MHRESCGGGPAGGDQLATGNVPEPQWRAARGLSALRCGLRAFRLGIGNGGIRGITSGAIPLGLEKLGAHNTYPVFGVWRLGLGVWGLATEDLCFRV
jgi:hypothetical protein